MAGGVREFPFPGPWPNTGKGWCCWCGDRITIEAGKRGAGGPNLRARWHAACVYEHQLHTRLDEQFAYVEKRDGLRCAWLACGAAPERWHGLGECTLHQPRPSFLAFGPVGSTEWFAAARAWAKANPDPVFTQIERRTALQLDHKVPLWSVADLPPDERRPYFGPENLWLLCPVHHKAKTKREAGQRAAIRALARAQLHLPI